MVVTLTRRFLQDYSVSSIVDLGCGDGSLLKQLSELSIPMWGYDAGIANVAHACAIGLDVRRGNLLADPLAYGDLIVATEVVEHLVDPHRFVRSLPGDKLILSSPSAEDADWHYEHHAWAWDMEGYADLVRTNGWAVVDHVECDAPHAYHGGIQRGQRFQAIAAIK